jgi:hypothetical protein
VGYGIRRLAGGVWAVRSPADMYRRKSSRLMNVQHAFEHKFERCGEA